jgi:hypothetical protein
MMELSESRFEAMYRDLIELRVLSDQRYVEASRRADACDQQIAVTKAEIRQDIKSFQAELKDLSNQLCAQQANSARQLATLKIIAAISVTILGGLALFLIQRVL